jgi:hypothetical protein
MNSESLLTLDQTTLFYLNRRGPNSPPEQLADVVKNWVAGVGRVERLEPPSRPASRASETVSAASMLEPDVHMGGISDDDKLSGREYAILSPPKGDTRMTSSVLFFKVVLYYLLTLTCLSENGKG